MLKRLLLLDSLTELLLPLSESFGPALHGILLLSGRLNEVGPFAIRSLWRCVAAPDELTRLTFGGEGALMVDFQLVVFAESLSKKLSVSEGNPRSRSNLFASLSKSASVIVQNALWLLAKALYCLTKCFEIAAIHLFKRCMSIYIANHGLPTDRRNANVRHPRLMNIIIWC